MTAPSTRPDVTAHASCETLVARAGLNPALRRVVLVAPVARSAADPRWALREGEAVEAAGHGTVRFVRVEKGAPVLEMPQTLTEVGWTFEAVHPLPPGAPATAEEYGARCAALDALLATTGGGHASSMPNGWLPILEAAAKALAALGVSDARLDYKEKFGTLRLSLSSEAAFGAEPDLNNFLHDIAAWAEACSEGRCMVFGTPGQRVSVGGWVHTLSAEGKALAADRRALADRVYPR